MLYRTIDFVLFACKRPRESQGLTPGSTTKTGRHDIAEILLKVALSTKNQINQSCFYFMRMQQIENKQ
jgi:hypothetical protein